MMLSPTAIACQFKFIEHVFSYHDFSHRKEDNIKDLFPDLQ